MTWYYRYEFKGIQRWILESNRLRDLAGGSALIERLTEQARSMVSGVGGSTIFAAAGGLLAEFPDKEKLEAFASEWPMFAAYHAPGLPIIQGWVDAASGPNALARLYQNRLAARRNLPASPLLEPGPWLERASRTGLPAIPPPADIPPSRARPTAWDEASVERERAVVEGGANRPLFGGALTAAEIETDEESWPDEPTAVIHADGSGVGRRIVAIGDDVKRLKDFSEALAGCTACAARESVDVVRAATGHGPLPFRPVVLGGDDMTVVLTARHALPFARRWLEVFERETERHAKSLGGRRLHAAAGITIVNRGFPFWRAYELADAACRDAKRGVLSGGEPSASALRFRRVTTALADESDRETTWRLDQLDALDRLLDAVRNLPRGTLRSWLGLVDAGDRRKVDREALWERAREVARPKDWKALADALAAVGAAPETGLFPGSAVRTPLREALVLAQLVRSRRKGGRG